MSENGMLQRRSFTNVTKLNPGKKIIMKTILLHPQRFRHGETGIPGSVRSRVRTFKLQTLLAPGKINIDSRKFLATYVVTYQVKLVAK